jgi:hypothetical protein
MKFKYGVYAARVKPGFEPVMLKPTKTLEQAIGLMEAMIRWFGKQEMFYVMLDQMTRGPVCWEGECLILLSAHKKCHFFRV